MSEFKRYRRTQIAELRPFMEGEELAGVAISPEDAKAGSPKVGDMIARNPKNYADQWLVSAAYFADNFEPLHAIEVGGPTKELFKGGWVPPKRLGIPRTHG